MLFSPLVQMVALKLKSDTANSWDADLLYYGAHFGWCDVDTSVALNAYDHSKIVISDDGKTIIHSNQFTGSYDGMDATTILKATRFPQAQGISGP